MNATADFLIWTNAPRGLGHGDLEEALGWFRKVTGQKATKMVLNPANRKLTEANGLAAEYSGGCLASEVWLSDRVAVSLQFGDGGAKNARERLDGTFFCSGCLEHVVLKERSERDMRFCGFCQQIVEGEYEIIAARRGKPAEVFYHPTAPSMQAKDAVSALAPTKTICPENVHADKDGKRGPYQKRKLPGALIRQLADGGMGTRGIATRLKKAHALDVSYKTVERVLSGKRQQLGLPIK